MKYNQTVLLIALCLISSVSLAQKKPLLFLKSGPVSVETEIKQSSLDSFNKKVSRYNNKAFAVLQFESIPTEGTKKALKANGIELLDYLPDNAYTVSITGNANLAILQQAKAKALMQLSPQQKMESGLSKGFIPSWAIKTAGTVDVWISFPKTYTVDEVIQGLSKINIDVISREHQSYHILSLRLARNRLTELASLPFIEYVQPAPSQSQPLNYNSRAVSRASLLNAAIADGGKGLNGEGVVVGVGDNADVQTHIDFAGRLIDRSFEPANGHGTHVTGTLAGAGNGIELYRGYASKATIVSQAFDEILFNAPTYVNDYGMVITNNSYGNNNSCDYFGTYDLNSRMMDQMAFDLPYLENVFAAGNSGDSSCVLALPGFHTVYGGYQSAKNVLTVGATTDTGAHGSFSSRGPVNDGRLKPELSTMGQFVASTWPTSIYSYNSGTSMAAPAASGGLALLYQRYRQLNGGSNPKNSLMKALICNGALDLGNSGPDYSNGFGWMNLLRSIDMIENNHYLMANSTNGTTNTHTITVPAGTAQLKVMLYWNDPPASVLSSHTLVNDLDLQVTDPSSTVYLPYILDATTANVNHVATTGTDHVNNIEQVVINNPAAGTYSVQVNGTAITQNPSQEYYVVYDVVPVQLKVTAPAGGEGFVPSSWQYDMLKICWEAYGYSSGTVKLEYSTDNGSSWNTIATGIDINRRLYTWWVPGVPTSQALVRVTNESTGESSTSNTFTILGQPTVSLASTQCEGYININWTAVTGATDYEVMMVKGDEMKSVATTTALSYTIGGLSKDSTYWVTVRARINGRASRRPQAVSRKPNSGTCAGSISDNDLKLDAILAPVSGRMFTSSQLSATTPVTIRIKNLDDAPITNFNVQYSVNGGAWITESVSATVPAQGTYNYTFISTVDLSAPGNYTIVTVVKNSNTDPVSTNDTAVVLVKNLDNQPLNLTSYFVDDIEAAVSATYQRDTLGLNGLGRYDFTPSTQYGRLRTYVNTGIANSGAKALTLDVDRLLPSGNVNYLKGTFNLSNYNVNTNDIRLDFQFNNHGQQPDPADRVWIRGSETQPWIEVYSLDDNQNDPGTYKKTSSIELSKILSANSQVFTPSFQVRWGQAGYYPATERAYAFGYSFDDIRIYQVFNDMQMQSIDAPGAASCALTSTTPIKVSIRNSSNSTINSIPVMYRVNNGSWVTETIPSIAANTTLQYTFTTTADLSALGTYTLQTVVDYSSDSFHENDTANINVVNNAVITSYPYLENFESSNGYWYTEGKHDSWEYGTPVSPRINRAASGAKAWKTRLAGNYNDNELSYLYSPCFNISGMTAPTLSFSVALDLEDCGTTLCDGAWVEYSTDGMTWSKLGASGNGTNWYNKATDQLWSIQGYTNWHVATIPLPTGSNNLHLRFVFQSDPATNHEGIAIDDIHIYDNTNGIYDGITMTTPVSQTVSGNGWIDFLSSGKLVASIQPNNQNLGTTAVQAYINTGGVRHTNSQYYHDRNITIKPAVTSLTDSVTVRFYFLDAETNSLISATGCNTCTKPSSAYELGISKYDDLDDNFENGTINDDNQGSWSFIIPDYSPKVPFDKGYYAEFKVKDFSEFWLNNGGFSKTTPLPVKLLDFTTQRSNRDVLLKWKVTEEINLSHYEIEVAKGNDELQLNHFTKIGEIDAQGVNSTTFTYSFTDKEADKSGVRYYRLKIVNNDGSYTYSSIRSVVFNEAITWQVYPNPSGGLFHLVYQLNNNELLHARLIDSKGSLVKEYHMTANGFLQKLNIDLSANSYASGVYLLQVEATGKKLSFKLYKQ